MSFNDPSSGLNKGRIVRLDDLNNEVMLVLDPTAGTDQQVEQMSGATKVFQDLKIGSKPIDNTKVPTDMQLLQYDNATGKFFFKDLVLATKSIDNTVVPTDGQVLTYDAASGKVKFKTATSSSLSEVQFLASQAALGNLIQVQGNRTNTGLITSYTPANGKTFTLYKAGFHVGNSVGTGTSEVQLRNNAIVREDLSYISISSDVDHKFGIKGDQLIGTGALVYDINLTTNVAIIWTGYIEGYIA